MKKLSGATNLITLLKAGRLDFAKMPRFIRLDIYERIEFQLSATFARLHGTEYNLIAHALYSNHKEVMMSYCGRCSDIGKAVYEEFFERTFAENLQAIKVDVFTYNDDMDEMDHQEKFYIGTWVFYF